MRPMSAAEALPWTIQRVLTWTASRFSASGLDGPRLQAELLLAHGLKTDRLHLYMDLQRPLTAAELGEVRALVQRRIAGEPTQHLVGSVHFYGRLFGCDRRALIPRPETEVLVEACLRALPVDADLELLDLCCGGGVVGLTLLAERPRYRAELCDVSAEACALAAENARRLELVDRMQLHQGDLLAPLLPDRRFDCLVANPPYVETADIAGLQTEVRDHDPHLALDGGADGLEVIRRIAAEARGRVHRGGLLALEIGEDQGARVSEILRGHGWNDVAVLPDLAKQDRVVTARG
jgi:release factor glutamine methyltransferase